MNAALSVHAEGIAGHATEEQSSADQTSGRQDGRSVETRLRLAADTEGRTYLAHHFAAYPHHITRPFYLDRTAPRAATVYLQSLAGGLTQDDNIALRISTTGRAIAHVTTQAATKIHSMERGSARTRTDLEALDESHLEFIADPSICFPRSRLVARTNLCVGADASAILADSYLWHDPLGVNAMAFDLLATETTIRRPQGPLLALDRSNLPAAGGLAGNPGLLGQYRALGTLFAVGRGTAGETMLAAVRESVAGLPGIYAGASLLPAQAGLWLRILAIDGAAMRTAMDRAWRECHYRMLGWNAGRRPK